MINWNNFCGTVIVLSLISLTSKGQQADSLQVKNKVLQENYSPIFNKFAPLAPLSGNSSKKISTNLGNPFAHWGFMCIGEYKLEQKTGIPLKLRLGSLDYVNKLEGKQ